MQREKLLSACIALALSSPTWAADTENVDETRQQTQVNCLADQKERSDSERKKLPFECQNSNDKTVASWIAVGVTSLISALAIDALSVGDNHHHHSTTPPPDDGDDVIPPDDGGDVIPPDDGGDVTPPDDGGDVTPPPTTIEFANHVTWDQTAKTLMIRDAIFTYTQNADSTYTLTTPDGRTTIVFAWQVDKTSNTIELDGVNNAGNVDWRYDNDGEIYITKKTGFVAEDDSSTLVIKAHDVVITDQGGNTALNGATVMDITGNNIVINNNGDSVATGEGSVIGVLTGDNITINNNGSTTIDGGTAAIITGDHATINNNGNTVITNGGTGTHTTGDFAMVDNTGTITVDGANTTGTLIDGNDATVKQDGDLYVSGGARGIEINGSKAKVLNKGKITVRDQDSVGILINGNDSIFANTGDIDVTQNGTGVIINGDQAQAELQGDINVTQEHNSAGEPLIGTGVSIEGDKSTVTLDGNINLVSLLNDNELTEKTDQPLTGMTITGDGNRINVNGQLNIYVEGDDTSDNAFIYGADISGSDNTVNLNGGVNISGDSAAHFIDGIRIQGDNTLTIGGHSTIDIREIMGNSALTSVYDGGHVVLQEDSVLDITSSIRNNNYYTPNHSVIYVQGSGSSGENKGTINTSAGTELMTGAGGAEIINSGTINAMPSENETSDSVSAMVHASGNGSTGTNAPGGVINIVSTTTPIKAGGMASYPVEWYERTYYALLASSGGSVANEAGSSINLHGTGVYGVSASKGEATNAGVINTDGFIPTLDEKGEIVSSSLYSTNSPYLMGGGMLIGSTDSGNATGLNTGTINVNNEGFGMLAMNGGTVTNSGTINLTADEGVTKQQNNQLFGMGAIKGGIAINDQNGVINIETDVGQAFYTDGSGTIVNYGTICTLGNCQDPATYNPTDSDVSAAWRNGDTITDEDETLTLSSTGGTTDPVATTDTVVTNAGTVTGGPITVADKGHLTNKTTGSIKEVDIATGGEYTNQGSTTTVSVDGGIFNNEGNVTGQTGTTVAGSVILNSGSLNTLIQWASNAWNTGSVSSWEGASGSAVMNNETGGKVEKVKFTAASTFNNAGTAHKVSVDHGGTFNNLEGGVAVMDSDALWSGHFNNWGTVEGDMKIATSGDAHTLYNGESGVINGQIQTANTKSKAINDGTINIDKTGNVAMSAHSSAKMVNNGIINVGTEGTTQTGMVGMQLESNATADAVIENNGTINIYASNSYAFSKLGSNGHIVNNGTVYIDDGVTGSGLLKQAGTAMEGKGDGGDGTEVHYVDFTAPEEPTITPYGGVSPSSVSGGSANVNSLNGYVVGTSADGSAGKLKVNNASMHGVEINTGFAAGTDATSITFDNVVQGSNLTDANAITSTSVVWSAQGSNDASGNVDVTMSKNAYTDVATDSSVNNVAKALDAGYTNNELYTSLNVGTTAELNSALKQISGSQATTVFREARILSNRFSMLADAAPQMGNGLAFNVVAKGDPRAELGNDTQYDMLALRNTLNLSENQTLSLEYGIARLDGDGSEKAGDNGVTGGYSQFFGLKHQMAFDNGLIWNNALRYDVHQLDSSRSVAYSDVNKTADTDVKQQYLELRSEGAKTFTLSEGLNVTPYAGLKLRHTLEDGYQERNAGDFNLNTNSGNETAVDSIAGLKLDYAGKNGWSANMTLEGGPNLSYAKSQRTASLAGASNQRFDLDDGQKGGGVNSLTSVGVKYSTEDSTLHLDAYQWKEDGISDKGLILKVKKTF